jgi:hypothetical protein
MISARAGAVLVLASASVAVAAATAACDSSSDGGFGAPAPAATDPGCKVIADTKAPLAGDPRDVEHDALAPDAGADASPSADGGGDASSSSDGDAAADAEPPPSPSPPADAGEDASDGGAGADGAAPPPAAASTLAAEQITTVACRQNTAVDTAAGAAGALHVLGSGVHGQLVTVGVSGSSVRMLDALDAHSGPARIGATPEGAPFVVARTSAGLVAIEGDAATARSVAGGDATLDVTSPVARNAAGALLFRTASSPPSVLVRSPDGQVTTRALPEAPSGAQSIAGIGDDGEPFRVLVTGTQVSVVYAGRTATIAEPAAHVAFATTGDASLPPVVAMTGERGEVRSLSVAIPTSGDYAVVPVVPRTKPCPPTPQCNNTCTQEDVEVEPTELDVTRDADDVYVVFVRRRVSREWRYQLESTSDNFICDFTDCPPDCSAKSFGTVVSAELVVGVVDVANRRVRETFSLPLDTDGTQLVVPNLFGYRRLVADARDGYLFVSFPGDYQGSFPGLTAYRLKIQSR